MILRYPVQRQSTPPTASMTSCSDGDEFLSSSAVADTSIPGVQAPHCAAPWTRKEVCKRLCMGDRLARPSTVVTSHPATWPAATRQAHTGSPSSSTVQAPQSPASQPTFVPVRPRSSRNTRERRRLPATLTSTLRPLTEKEMSCDCTGDVGVCAATSGSPHASFQRSPDQSYRGIPPVLGRCPDVVNRRQSRQMLRADNRADLR